MACQQRLLERWPVCCGWLQLLSPLQCKLGPQTSLAGSSRAATIASRFASIPFLVFVLLEYTVHIVALLNTELLDHLM
jgi:hypothetical protein